MTSIFLSLAVFILSFVVVKLLPSGPPFVRNGVILYALSNIQPPLRPCFCSRIYWVSLGYYWIIFRMKILTKGELHSGAEYFGSSKLSLGARWDATINKFKVTRFRYGYFFLEDLPHPDDAQTLEDSFKPYHLMTEIHDLISQGSV